jgi:esterase/lipase superfamily enzyme
MLHYFITNRAIKSDTQGEYVNEDGGESACENMRCGTFDSKEFRETKSCRRSMVLFEDAPVVKRSEVINLPLPPLYDSADITTPTHELFGSARLFTELYSQMSGEDGGDLLFFVHGFHADLPGALESVCDLEAKYINNNSPIKHIVFFTWPAMNRLLRYRSDAKDAELSGFTLARCYLMLLDFFKTSFVNDPNTHSVAVEPCGHSIHLLAHSMGNRVIENMMIELCHQKKEGLTALFKEVILAASDVDWQVFETPRVFYDLVNICQRVTVYFNTKDIALLISETTKNSYNRLGKFGFRDFHKVPSHIYSVDCTGVHDEKGVENELVGHWYYKESKSVVEDITRVLDGVHAEDFVSKSRNAIPGNAAQYRLRI